MTKPPQFSQILKGASDAATAVLSRGAPVAEAAVAAIAAADAFLEHAARTLPGLAAKLTEIQCAAGCGTCCHQMVGVTVAEGQHLSAFVLALPAPQRQRIIAQARAIAARPDSTDPARWWAARIACPLLDENAACQAHPARPLPCRGFNSSDRAACVKMEAGEAVLPPTLSAQLGIYANAQAGLHQALVRAGQARPMTTLAHTLAALPD